jgi:hypothetical protein
MYLYFYEIGIVVSNTPQLTCTSIDDILDDTLYNQWCSEEYDRGRMALYFIKDDGTKHYLSAMLEGDESLCIFVSYTRNTTTRNTTFTYHDNMLVTNGLALTVTRVLVGLPIGPRSRQTIVLTEEMQPWGVAYLK